MTSKVLPFPCLLLLLSAIHEVPAQEQPHASDAQLVVQSGKKNLMRRAARKESKLAGSRLQSLGGSFLFSTRRNADDGNDSSDNGEQSDDDDRVATCNEMTKCPVDHRLKANAAALACEGALCDEIVDAEQCCEEAVDTSSCTSRQMCVEAFFEHLTSYEFVEFECACNEQYLQYIANHVWPDGTTDECKQFIACLNNGRGASAKVLTGLAKALKATTTTELIEHKNTADKSSYNSSCFTPSPEKYQELTECNCLKELVNVCGDDAGTLSADECLKEHACGHEEVCDDWQAANCPSMSLQLHARGGIPDALNEDSAHRLSSSGDAPTSLARVDEMLQTKCG